MNNLEKIFKDNWGSTFMVYNGQKINLLEIEHIEIYNDNTLEGIASFFEDETDIHIVSMDALKRGQGIGTRMLEEIIFIAQNRHKKNIYVETTNDNCDAMRFYQIRGFDMFELQRNEVVNQRKIKDSIPLLGNAQIPIKHIIRFKKQIKN